MKPIAEKKHLDAASLRDGVLPGFEPVVIRGLARDWPAVQAGRQGAATMAAYLLERDSGKPVDALLARPEPGRTFGNKADYSGFNFLRDRRPLSSLIEQLGRYAQFEAPPALAAQSALIDQCLPRFGQENRLDALLDPSIRPRIWIGNQATVPAHFDSTHNLAVVACGRRRFTLFPPDQVGNLSLGPPDLAPTTAPITLAEPSRPDFERFPKLRTALDSAFEAELQPGDAIYIPPLWLHQVDSLDALNVLVNYWWRPTVQPSGRNEDHLAAALWISMLSLRHLPTAERLAWGEMFRYFVFDEPDAALARVPENRRGLFGPLDAEQANALRKKIAAWLQEGGVQ